MKDKAWAAVALLAATIAATGAASAECGAPGCAWAPKPPRILPASDGAGSYGLRLRLVYLETMTGNLEIRRHQYFADEHLKAQWPRTSVAWQFRWYF